MMSYLEVWRQLHSRHTVDVLSDFVEEVLQATDNLALVLIVD